MGTKVNISFQLILEVVLRLSFNLGLQSCTFRGWSMSNRESTVAARISPLKLGLSMIGVWALVTALATLILVAVLTALGILFFGLYRILGFRVQVL
jgi:hypothetical protein